MKADLSHLDHKYRAKRTRQSPIEYAASIQRFERPSRRWPVVALTAILLLAAAALKVMS